MWFGFMFFGNLFAFDTVNSKNEPVATEPFCTSSIQCLLFFINFGIRSGGGIGDLLGMQSFKDNYIFLKLQRFAIKKSNNAKKCWLKCQLVAILYEYER